MTTPSAFARNATKALQQMVDVSSGGLDCEGAAAIIEEAIRRAMRERDVTAHRELKAAHAAADERLMQLLSASPAVIYKLQGERRFCADFCQWKHRRRLRLLDIGILMRPFVLERAGA